MARKNHKRNSNKNVRRYEHNMSKSIQIYQSDTLEPDSSSKPAKPAKKRRHKLIPAEAFYEIAREVFGVEYCPPKESDDKT